MGIGGLDRPKHLTLAANELNAPSAFHPAGDLAGVSLGLGRRGGMPRKYG
jgi:hypothetical protein